MESNTGVLYFVILMTNRYLGREKKIGAWKAL